MPISMALLLSLSSHRLEMGQDHVKIRPPALTDTSINFITGWSGLQIIGQLKQLPNTYFTFVFICLSGVQLKRKKLHGHNIQGLYFWVISMVSDYERNALSSS